MPNDIKCPNCGHVFDVENVLAADIEIKYQHQYQQKLQQSLGKIEQDKKKLEEEQQQFEDKKKKENEIFAQKLQQERLKSIRIQLVSGFASEGNWLGAYKYENSFP